jgi:hypothetical protein
VDDFFFVGAKVLSKIDLWVRVLSRGGSVSNRADVNDNLEIDRLLHRRATSS